MTLALEVIGPQAVQLGAAARKVFAAEGGTIGRLPDNDWVIPGPFVSACHARIHYRDGGYFLEDTSSNGICVKSPGNRLRKGELYELRSGERVFIDAYEIKVVVAPASGRSEREATLVSATVVSDGADMTLADDVELTATLKDAEAFIDALTKEPQDWRAEMQTAVLPKTPPRPSHIHEAPAPKPVPERFMPPPRSADPVKAKGFEPPASRPPATMPVEPVPVTAKRTLSDDAGLSALLAAAGIAATEMTPAMMQDFGRLIRVMVAGLVDALRSREQVKDELGMRMTTFKAANNNPLKFSVNAEDALHNLFAKRNAAYLHPVEAVEEAFQELRYHQMAMLAAVRAMFGAACREFDPRRLQAEFDRELTGSRFSFLRKERYWRLYQSKFGDLAKDPDRSFRELFGERFTQVYEEQLEGLKAGGGRRRQS